jgi:hypothetical protein
VFIPFDARCRRCGNQFKAEAEIDLAPGPADGAFRYTCPRCYTPATAAACDGRASEVPTPWAVRAAEVGKPEWERRDQAGGANEPAEV